MATLWTPIHNLLLCPPITDHSSSCLTLFNLWLHSLLHFIWTSYIHFILIVIYLHILLKCHWDLWNASFNSEKICICTIQHRNDYPYHPRLSRLSSTHLFYSLDILIKGAKVIPYRTGNSRTSMFQCYTPMQIPLYISYSLWNHSAYLQKDAYSLWIE